MHSSTGTENAMCSFTKTENTVYSSAGTENAVYNVQFGKLPDVLLVSLASAPEAGKGTCCSL